MRRAFYFSLVLLSFAAESGAQDIVPEWFPKAPPLPPPQGEVIVVQTAEQLVSSLENAAVGVTVLVPDGEYQLPRTMVLNGRTNITLRSCSGEPQKVILLGNGWDGPEKGGDILHIARCDGVTVANITLAEARAYGIKVEAENGPQNVHIYNCRFRNIGVRALKGSAGNDPAVRAVHGSVRFCSFENTKIPPANWLFGGDYIAAIDMMALEDWRFSQNVFRNIKGRNGGGRAAIFIWVRSRDVIVERNLILNCDRGVAFGNPGQSTANLAGEKLVYVANGLIRNNFIAGGPDCGIELWHGRGLKVLNNSIWRSEENWRRGIRVGTGVSESEIANNLIHGEISMEGGDAQFRNNVTGRLPGYFSEPSVGDLRLMPVATNAIDKGISLTDVVDDIRGRPRSNRPDIGAWEIEKVTEKN